MDVLYWLASDLINNLAGFRVARHGDDFAVEIVMNPDARPVLEKWRAEFFPELTDGEG